LLKCNCASAGIERRKGFETVEQFVLAYVMDELYKKQWSGQRWVSREEWVRYPERTTPAPTITAPGSDYPEVIPTKEIT
jgi:hypothetical protein